MSNRALKQALNRGRAMGGWMIALLVWICCAGAIAQEITNFKFTGYEASVSTQVQSDTSNTVTPIANSTDVIKTDQKQTDVRLEATVMTHSYVYHPKFLSLDIGFGAISATNTVQTNDIYSKTREPLYNYSLHGSVLPEKPMHGTFFFDRINTTPALGTGESFNQINDKYGFTTTVMSPLLPATVLLDVTREQNKGQGSFRTLDEKLDRVGVSVRKEISKYGSTELILRSFKQDSTNGVVDLPTLTSTQESKSVSADTRLRLGTTTLYDLDNRIEYSTQTYNFSQAVPSELKDYRFGLFARGYHSADLTSFASFQSNRTEQELFFNKSNAVSGGAIWVLAKDFDVSGSVHANNAQATQFSNRAMGFDASTRYTRSLAIGTLATNYSMRYEKFDQTSIDPVTSVTDEAVAMNRQSNPVTLSFPNVLSISSVRNKILGTVFIEGVDYVTQVFNRKTTIYFFDSVFLDPNISEGDIVLVSYTYDNGGTYGSSQLDQSVSMTWTLSPQFNMFARYSDSSPKVTSGSPSIAVNQVKSIWYGLRANVPLSMRYDLVFTGNLDQENRREDNPTDTNSSYVRTSADVYVRGEFPTDFSNDYRVGMRRVHLVADITTQSVDQTAYELAFGWRTSSGLNLVATGLLERDSDYLTERERKTVSLRALWRYRRFFASADVERIRETQDLFSRDRTVARLTLRRDL